MMTMNEETMNDLRHVRDLIEIAADVASADEGEAEEILDALAAAADLMGGVLADDPFPPLTLLRGGAA